jgi:hypothetical protein
VLKVIQVHKEDKGLKVLKGLRVQFKVHKEKQVLKVLKVLKGLIVPHKVLKEKQVLKVLKEHKVLKELVQVPKVM